MRGSTPSRALERVGKKDRRFQLCKPTETVGDAQVTYTPQGNPVWGSFEERGGADFSGMVAEATAVIVIWHRSDVTPRWCVEMGAGASLRRFEIDSVSDVDGRQVELELVCHEIKSLSD